MSGKSSVSLFSSSGQSKSRAFLRLLTTDTVSNLSPATGCLKAEQKEHVRINLVPIRPASTYVSILRATEFFHKYADDTD